MYGDYLSPMNMNIYWGSIREAFKTQGQQAVNYVKNLGDMKGIKVEPVLLEGNPSAELIRYAEEEKNGYCYYGHSREDRTGQDASGQRCRKYSSSLEGSCYGCKGKL